MNQLSLLDLPPSVVWSMFAETGIDMASGARPHVVGRRADVSDATQPEDELDAFMQAQLRRLRGSWGRAVNRVAIARSKARKERLAVGQACSVVTAMDATVKGHVKGHKGRAIHAATDSSRDG